MYNFFKNVKANVQLGLLLLMHFLSVKTNFRPIYLFSLRAKETAFNSLSHRYVSNCLYKRLIQKHPDTCDGL